MRRRLFLLAVLGLQPLVLGWVWLGLDAAMRRERIVCPMDGSTGYPARRDGPVPRHEPGAALPRSALWQPDLVTGEDGVARVPIAGVPADTWVTVEAHTRDGAVGVLVGPLPP